MKTISKFKVKVLKNWETRKAIGRAKAGKGEEPVAKFRKFEKTENTFTLKIRETWQK